MPGAPPGLARSARNMARLASAEQGFRRYHLWRDNRNLSFLRSRMLVAEFVSLTSQLKFFSAFTPTSTQLSMNRQHHLSVCQFTKSSTITRSATGFKIRQSDLTAVVYMNYAAPAPTARPAITILPLVHRVITARRGAGESSCPRLFVNGILLHVQRSYLRHRTCCARQDLPAPLKIPRSKVNHPRSPLASGRVCAGARCSRRAVLLHSEKLTIGFVSRASLVSNRSRYMHLQVLITCIINKLCR